MNVIGHHTIFIYGYIIIMIRYLHNSLFRNLACIGQRHILRADNIRPYAIPKDFISICGTDRYEICAR